LIHNACETIQTQLEEIRRPADPHGTIHIRSRCDHANNARPGRR
jgi:hypothetical protein